MTRFLAYAIIFANIMAVITVTIIQPQSTSNQKKKRPQDIRQYLLAQTCPQYTDPNGACYMPPMTPPQSGCNDDASCAAYCGSTSNPSANASQGNCPGYLNYQCYSAHTPEYWMWNGSSCTRYEMMPLPPPPSNPFGGSGGSGSSGGSGETTYYAGNEQQRNIVQEGCLTELKYSEPKKNEEERILSRLGIQMEREGVPDTIIEDVKSICFGLNTLTAGKMGNDAFQNGTAEKTLKDAANYSLNNALQPNAGESIQGLTKRVLHEYLVRVKKEAFDPLQKIKDTNAYLVDPMKHISTVVPKIKEIIASYQPKEEAAVETPKEAVVVEPTVTPVETAIVVVATPPKIPTVEPKPQENIAQRILNILKRALGITREDREKGLRQNKIRTSSPKQIWARRDRTRAIRDTFQKKRAEYCTTHSC